MIYKWKNHIHLLQEQTVNRVDWYDCTTMNITNTSNAQTQIKALKLVATIPNPNGIYILDLTFGNNYLPIFSAISKDVKNYLVSKNLQVTTTQSFDLRVSNLTIQDIIKIINDTNFQALNPSNTSNNIYIEWKLYK